MSKNARIILFSLLDSLQIMGMPPAWEPRVYLWEDEIEGQEPVMVVEYKPVEWGQDYDIVHDPEKFQMYVDGELMENP